MFEHLGSVSDSECSFASGNFITNHKQEQGLGDAQIFAKGMIGGGDLTGGTGSLIKGHYSALNFSFFCAFSRSY